MVRIPPYFLARMAHRWHGLCALCHEPLGHLVCPSSSGRADGRPAVTLCSVCDHLIAWRLPPVRLTVIEPCTHITPPTRSFPLYAATFYQYPINQALSGFKDHEDLSSFMILLHAIGKLPKPIGCHANNTVIMPIPTTNRRLVKRGFDPVMMLVKSLAYQWQLPVWQGLDRIDDVIHQRGLDRQARLDNIQQAFVLKQMPPVQRLIIFDDVATTGATVQAVASVLLERVPELKIMAVCVAHGTADFSWLAD